MHKSPDFAWDGPFAYDALAPAGVTPESSMKDVVDSMRHFTRLRQVASVHAEWMALQKIESRLLLDFFLQRDGS